MFDLLVRYCLIDQEFQALGSWPPHLPCDTGFLAELVSVREERDGSPFGGQLLQTALNGSG